MFLCFENALDLSIYGISLLLELFAFHCSYLANLVEDMGVLTLHLTIINLHRIILASIWPISFILCHRRRKRCHTWRLMQELLVFEQKQVEERVRRERYFIGKVQVEKLGRLREVVLRILYDG